jgi:hypothetical protein
MRRNAATHQRTDKSKSVSGGAGAVPGGPCAHDAVIGIVSVAPITTITIACAEWSAARTRFPARRRVMSVFCSGLNVIRTPVEAPNANAHADDGSPPSALECLDRILILGRRHLEYVLRVYRRHYNEHRPHLRRHDLLGGLIHEYEAA